MRKEDMTVERFVKAYSAVNDSHKAAMIKNIIKDKYISLAVKNAMSRQTIAQFSMKDNEYHSDTVMMYLTYAMTLIHLYTNLELQDGKWIDEYDMLQRYGLIEEIANEIGADVKEFQNVFNMCKDDFNKNHLTVQAFVQRQVNKVLGVLTPALNKVATNLEHIDLSKLEEIMRNVKGEK